MHGTITLGTVCSIEIIIIKGRVFVCVSVAKHYELARN